MALMVLYLSVPYWLCMGWAGRGTLGKAVWTCSLSILIHLETSSLSLLFSSFTLLNVGSTPAESFMFWRQPTLTSCPGNTPFSLRSYMGSHL